MHVSRSLVVDHLEKKYSNESYQHWLVKVNKDLIEQITQCVTNTCSLQSTFSKSIRIQWNSNKIIYNLTQGNLRLRHSAGMRA